MTQNIEAIDLAIWDQEPVGTGRRPEKNVVVLFQDDILFYTTTSCFTRRRPIFSGRRPIISRRRSVLHDDVLLFQDDVPLFQDDVLFYTTTPK